MEEHLLSQIPDESHESAEHDYLLPHTSTSTLETRILIPDAALHVVSNSFHRPPADSSSSLSLAANYFRKRNTVHKSYSAPSFFTDIKGSSLPLKHHNGSLRSTPPIVSQAFFGVMLYVSASVVFYVATSKCFHSHATFRLVDALYFSVVTLCTIGYGDIVPSTTFTKLFTCGFILVGFGFIDILLNGLLTYVLDRQEAVLLSSVDDRWGNNAVLGSFVMDMKKGRMRIRMKVGLALAVVICCIVFGMIMVHVLEGLSWVDSFYLSVTSVTTVGYGDHTFRTTEGRLFATVWLLVSTLAVARAFLYLTELRIDKRNRRIAKWVLQRKMTLGDLKAADLDNDGSIRKSEYVIYKLKEMGKIAEKDIQPICHQFDRLDTGNCGRLILSDLMESLR
ncbi:two pore potassium channel c-like [Aristolochia californica]|uniref:two pore potassium channel c-like n=1 Tax=Aristolochia californica TaxID=171875 RepID=UPI0035DA7F93